MRGAEGRGGVGACGEKESARARSAHQGDLNGAAAGAAAALLVMTVMEMDMEGLVVLRGCGEEDPGAVRGQAGGGQAVRLGERAWVGVRSSAQRVSLSVGADSY